MQSKSTWKPTPEECAAVESGTLTITAIMDREHISFKTARVRLLDAGVTIPKPEHWKKRRARLRALAPEPCVPEKERLPVTLAPSQTYRCQLCTNLCVKGSLEMRAHLIKCHALPSAQAVQIVAAARARILEVAP